MGRDYNPFPSVLSRRQLSERDDDWLGRRSAGTKITLTLVFSKEDDELLMHQAWKMAVNDDLLMCSVQQCFAYMMPSPPRITSIRRCSPRR